MAYKKKVLRLCRIEGCLKRIRTDNRSRTCVEHRTKKKNCRRCLNPCSDNATLCQPCNQKNRVKEAEGTLDCWEPGCTQRVRGKSGYCWTHWKLGKTCEFEGCTVQLVKTSKTGFCRTHMWKARKFREILRESSSL